MATNGVNGRELDSTVDFEAARKQIWDVVVVGAGLAGSISARGLAKAGYRTLLVDRGRFPRSKVCGCCLTKLGTRTLEAIGLGHVLPACGAQTLREVHLFAGAEPTRIPLIEVQALSRDALDAHLAAEAVDAGAELLLDSRADPSSDGSVTLHSKGQDVRVEARVVVLASGLRAHEGVGIRKRGRDLIGIGALAPNPKGRYPDGVVGMVIDKAGYVGIAPLEDGRLTIASALRADAVKKASSPKSAVETILLKAGLEDLVDVDVRFSGVPTLGRHRQSVQEGKMLAVGDAAGFVEPITGEGMSWAIATGAAVVSSASAMLGNQADSNSWEKAYRRMMRKRHLRCAFVGSCIRRPSLVRTAVLASRFVPMMRAPVLSGLLGHFDPSIEGELA